MVHHYFGSKEQLFLATIEVPLDPQSIVDGLAAGPVETIGERLAATVLGAWESEAGPALVAAMRAAIADPTVAGPISEFLSARVIRRVLRAAGCPAREMDLRGALVASQIAGVIAGRHVLRLPPLVAAPLEDLVANLGPTLQHYLTGPLVPPG